MIILWLTFGCLGLVVGAPQGAEELPIDPHERGARLLEEAKGLRERKDIVAARARAEEACAQFREARRAKDSADTAFALAICEDLLAALDGRESNAYPLWLELVYRRDVAPDLQREAASRRQALTTQLIASGRCGTFSRAIEESCRVSSSYFDCPERSEPIFLEESLSGIRCELARARWATAAGLAETVAWQCRSALDSAAVATCVTAANELADTARADGAHIVIREPGGAHPPLRFTVSGERIRFPAEPILVDRGAQRICELLNIRGTEIEVACETRDIKEARQFEPVTFSEFGPIEGMDREDLADLVWKHSAMADDGGAFGSRECDHWHSIAVSYPVAAAVGWIAATRADAERRRDECFAAYQTGDGSPNARAHAGCCAPRSPDSASPQALGLSLIWLCLHRRRDSNARATRDA